MKDGTFLQRFATGLFAVGLAVLPVGLQAQANNAQATDAEVTARAARLTYMQGTVTVSDATNGGAAPAQLNLPLLAGVQLSTGGDGQAEVEFEDGSVVRLTPNSALSLDTLAVEPGGIYNTSMSLLQGLAYFELRAAPEFLYTVNAGGDLLSPVENTTVRVNFDEPPASFAVLDGTAQVERMGVPTTQGNGALFETDVRAGETLRGDADGSGRYALTQEIAQDSWDQWNEDRDQAAAAEADNSTDVRNNYAGADGYGWSDLDADGTWYNVPGQGPVWQPQLAFEDASFDPYGDGSWVWYPGVGYVWASDYDWGWTPYRCGLWSYYGGFGWGWAPGASCGGLGWGFAGGGYLVNIGTVPRGYRPVRVPAPVHAPQHPMIPVRTWVPTQRAGVGVSVGASAQRGPRQIAGLTANPVQPVRSGFVNNGGTAGQSLRRDYPIDAKSKTPVLGLASTQPAGVRTTPQPRGAVGAPTGSPAPAGTPGAAFGRPVQQGQQQQLGQQQPRQQGQGQQQQPAPAVRTVPNQPVQPQQPAPAQRGLTPPPAATQQRGLTPPNQVQRTAPVQRSAPPPQMQRSAPPPPRPSYSPPRPPPPPPAPRPAPAPQHK